MRKFNLMTVTVLFLNIIAIGQPSNWPIASQNEITSPFGSRREAGRVNNYDFHSGIDIKAFVGNTVYATVNGIIDNYGGTGENKWVLIRTDVGNGNYDYYRYTHIDRNTQLDKGAQVKKGMTIIGTVAEYSCNASDGNGIS